MGVALGQLLLLQRPFAPFLHGFSTYNRDLGWGQKWPEVARDWIADLTLHSGVDGVLGGVGEGGMAKFIIASNITGILAKGLAAMLAK